MLPGDGVFPVVSPLAPAVEQRGSNGIVEMLRPNVGVAADVGQLVELDVAAGVEGQAVAVEVASTAACR